MSLLSEVNSRSPPSMEIDECWGAGGKESASESGEFVQRLVELGQLTEAADQTRHWESLKEQFDVKRLVHSPVLMRFLHSCVKENNWPESIICDILLLGGSGPHVVNILDRANEKSSLNVLTASNHSSFPERVLVWSLSAAMAELKSNEHAAIGELDFILRREFSHDHLVGALRSLDSTEAVALLDFLTVKIRQCPLRATPDKAGVEQLSRWMGAVVDAHPTTYTSDNNEALLRDALTVVEEKLDLLAEYDLIEKVLTKSFSLDRRSKSAGKYSVHFLSF